MNETYRMQFPTLAALTAPARPALRRSGPRLQVELGRWLSAARQTFERRHRRERTRQTLLQFDDRVLRDIGLRRADLGPELEAPFLGLGEPLAREPGAGRAPSRRASRVGLWHL